jgi:integrase
MTSRSIGQIIRMRTDARFGAGYGPHFVRYLTVTYLADSEPEHIADVAAVLAHSSLETSEQNYILANSRRVIAKFREVLSSRLRETGM